jgi:hypothetical protein
LRPPIVLTRRPISPSKFGSLTLSQILLIVAFMWPALCFLDPVPPQDARLVIVNVARNGGHSGLDLTWTWLQQNHGALLAKLGGEGAP